MACMNWALVQHKDPALLRLAGREIRAVVSERYAPVDDTLLLELVGETLE